MKINLKSFSIRILPFLFLFILWFIFASPYFIKNNVPYPSKYQVNFFPPWSSYEKFWGPVKNNAMPDITDQIYPWRHFTIEAWKSGQIPFWNPYNFSGNPHLANFQSVVFSPFNILFFLLPFIDAWSVLVLLQPILAGFFTYILMREFRVSKTGSLLSSISFMFCGFMVVWMAYGTLSFAISFLPLTLFAIKRIFDKADLISIILLIISLPLSFFSGHFQTSLYLLVFSLFFIIYQFLITQKFKKTMLAVLFLIIGLLFSLPQIIPSIQFYLNSVRSEIFIKGGGIPFYYLINLFSPDFFGNPVTRNDWFGYYAEWASFIGIIPFTLILFSDLKNKTKPVIFFLLMSLLILILAVDSPVQKIIGLLKIPVLSTSEPSRAIVLLSFSFSILAGFGLDNLKEMIRLRKIKSILFPYLIIGIILATIWFLILFLNIFPLEKLVIAKRNLLLPTLLFAISSIIVAISFLNKKLISFVLFSLLVIGSFDSLRFAQKWIPFDPKGLVFPELPVIEAMQKNIGYGRFFGNLGAQIATYYNLSSIEGYDPLYIGRYGEFVRSSEKGEFLEGERSVVKIDRNSKYIDRVLDFLGVNLIFHPIADTNQSWAFPVWKDKKRFSLIYQDNKFQLFSNNSALPRVNLFYEYEIIKDKKQIIKKFYSDNFDFRKKIILEENVGSIKPGKGATQILKYSPNYIKIKTKTDTPAILFLSDNDYPDWKAKINDEETKIYRANYTFRAVVVPKGESIIEFNCCAWFF